MFFFGDITKGRNILFVATMPPFGGPGHPLPQDREVPWPQAATILIVLRAFSCAGLNSASDLIHPHATKAIAVRGLDGSESHLGGE